MGERHNGGYGEEYREEYRGGERRRGSERERGFRLRDEDEFMPQATGSRQREDWDDMEHGRSQRFGSSRGGQQREREPEPQWGRSRDEESYRQGERTQMPQWGRDIERDRGRGYQGGSDDWYSGRQGRRDVDEGGVGGFGRLGSFGASRRDRLFGTEGQHGEYGQDVGRHAGRGPKGYRRSDERIREDACDALTADPYVDATDVSVKVENGEVTIDGTIEDRRMKRRAEDCVEELPGVRQVHNRLVIQSPSEQPGGGSSIGTSTASGGGRGSSVSSGKTAS